MAQVKFLVFADLHHYPGVFCTDARRRLKELFARAEKEKVDFAVSLGDFNHSVGTFPELIEDLKESPVPVYHVMGNHDTDGATLDEVLKAYNMPAEYYYKDICGFRFIMLDTNYYKHHGGITHFQYRNYFDFPNSREFLPDEELEFLDNALMSSPYPCVLFSHASLERRAKGGAGLVNQSVVRQLIRKANDAGKKVMLSCNGHHHRDNIRILDNVVYFDVNSASFDWLNAPHSLFPEELRNAYELADHQAIFTDALSAVVTLDSDGLVKIEGSKSDFLHGITREMSGNQECDGAGRPCVAEVQSAMFRLL